MHVELLMTNDIFGAGARLGDHPSTDPSRQAVASLRGYAYQLYASGLAWVKLRRDECLYLEVAEDYAILAQSSINAVQVKDTYASGTVTLNSKDIRQTIDAFVDLVVRNPNRQVTVRFLSTAEIGIERSIDHRVQGIGGLTYWRQAAHSSDVEPLRIILERLDLKAATINFIRSCSGDELREKLLKNIQWDCGKADIKSLAEDLESDLISFGASEQLFGFAEVDKISASIISHLLKLTIENREQDRRLTQLDFRRLVDDATKVSINRNDFDRLLKSVAQPGYSDTGQREFCSAEDLLEPESLFPLPSLLVSDRMVVRSAKNKLIQHKVVSIVGATGMGKTVIARQVSREIGGSWFILDARDTAPEATKDFVRKVIAEIGGKRPKGIIIDDANFISEGISDRAVGKLFRYLKSFDVYLLLTSYKPISGRSTNDLMIEPDANVAALPFTEGEVKILVKDAGGTEEIWGGWVFHNASLGHPQLVMATIRGLQARRWSVQGSNRFEMLSLSRADIESEQERVRKILVNTLPEPTKHLLYRLSLVHGQFDRPLALVSGEVVSKIYLPGEQLDKLIGPWIDQVSRKEFRVSPLVLNAGEKVLPKQEVREVHKIVAEELISGGLVPSKMNSALLHGIAGESVRTLLIIANGILKADSESLRESGWSLFAITQLSTSKPIYKPDPSISSLLRLAQLSLRVEVGSAESIRECWDALQRECGADESSDSSFELIALFKLLLASPIVEAIPEWPSLLLRLDSLLGGYGGEFPIPNIDQSQDEEGGSIISVIFINQIRGIQSSQRLYELVQQMDQLSNSERMTLLADIKNVSTGVSLISGTPWFNESKIENSNWKTAQQYYLLVAQSFFDWGFPELSIEYHVVRSVIIEQYGGEYQAAVIGLMEAEKKLGPRMAFVRRRAQILFRHNAQDEGISLLQPASGFARVNVLLPEQGFWLRDAAISLASAGKWAEAQSSFELAQQAAAASAIPEMRVMAIGLRADAALAAYQANKRQDAIRLLMLSMKELQFLDPIESTMAAYCHRVIRHGLLWMLNILSDGGYLVDGLPPKMVAGMCSNPEPPDSIKTLPLAPLEMAWYLLAEIDLRCGGVNGADAVLKEMVQYGESPVMELGVRRLRLDAAIMRGNAEDMFDALRKYVEVRRYIGIHKDEIMQQKVDSPLYVKIPAVPLELIFKDVDLQSFIRSVLIAFGLFVATSGRSLDDLKSSAGKLLTYNSHLSDLVNMMVAGPGVEAAPANAAGIYIYHISKGGVLSVDDTYEVCVNLIYIANGSEVLRDELVALVSKWIRNSWRLILSMRSGELNDPRFIPVILECLRMPDSLRSAVLVLFAAERSTCKCLSSTQRSFLLSLSKPIA